MPIRLRRALHEKRFMSFRGAFAPVLVGVLPGPRLGEVIVQKGSL